MLIWHVCPQKSLKSVCLHVTVPWIARREQVGTRVMQERYRLLLAIHLTFLPKFSTNTWRIHSLWLWQIGTKHPLILCAETDDWSAAWRRPPLLHRPPSSISLSLTANHNNSTICSHELTHSKGKIYREKTCRWAESKQRHRRPQDGLLFVILFIDCVWNLTNSAFAGGRKAKSHAWI